jgi:hypothetical protein
MATPAQIAANQKNALRSTGPRSPETKAISAKNSMKHGMSGDGRALPGSDLVLVEEKTAAYLREYNPQTERGKDIVGEMAMLTVRLKRIGQHSLASSDSRERNAAEKFDEKREDLAQELFEGLAGNPRMNLRKLMRMPEGVEELRIGWTDLRAELTRERRPTWTPSSLERAAHMQGLRSEEAEDCELAELSERLWAESDQEKAAEIRWQLAEMIDGMVAELVEHFQALDHDRIALDREGSGLLARFEPNKAMELMHRYESEASRRYSRCLKELQEVEARAKVEDRPKLTPPPPPRPVQTQELASFGVDESMVWDEELLAIARKSMGPYWVPDFGIIPPDLALKTPPKTIKPIN